MRKALGALAILTLVGTSIATTQPAAHAAAPTGYELSWNDEFDGTSLDTSKWGNAYGCFDPRLKTQTHYTDSSENVSVSGGYLHLTARHSPTREKWNKETRKMETHRPDLHAHRERPESHLPGPLHLWHGPDTRRQGQRQIRRPG